MPNLFDLMQPNRLQMDPSPAYGRCCPCPANCVQAPPHNMLSNLLNPQRYFAVSKWFEVIFEVGVFWKVLSFELIAPGTKTYHLKILFNPSPVNSKIFKTQLNHLNSSETTINPKLTKIRFTPPNYWHVINQIEPNFHYHSSTPLIKQSSNFVLRKNG